MNDRSAMAGCRAFTLVELLVAIVIIGALMALAFVLVSAISRSAARIEGIAKLRDIGLAMNHHALDHGGFLPGPLKQGQSPVPAKSGHLVSYVKPYMFPDEALGYKNVQPGFVSKAWMKWFRSSGLEGAATYYINVAIPSPGQEGVVFFPFGNVGAKSSNNRPVSYPDLWKSNIPVSETPAMWDWMGTEGVSAPYGEFQNGINVLYFDWHVENTTNVDRIPNSVYKPKGW